MSVIKVKVVDQQLFFTNRPVIASGGINEDTIEFEFSNEWDRYYKKYVLFYRDKTEVRYGANITTSNVCRVPYDLTVVPGTIYFGVIGYYDGEDAVYTTELAEYEIAQGSWKPNESEISNPNIYRSDVRKLFGFIAKQYTITRNYSNGIVSNNNAYYAEELLPYVETLTVSGTLTQILVTMGGDDVTSQVFNSENNTINITSVTGNIVITAVAESSTPDPDPDPEPGTYYNIYQRVINGTSSNNATSIASGETFHAVYTPNSGYTLSTDPEYGLIVFINDERVNRANEFCTINGSEVTVNIPNVTARIDIYVVYVDEGSQTETYYTVQQTIQNGTSSNNATSVRENTSFVATYTPNSGYDTVGTTAVFMGEDNITSQVLTVNGTTVTVNIPNVTDEITIFVTYSSTPGTYYNVRQDISNGTSSNNATSIAENSSFVATYSPNSGYTKLTQVVVYMGNDYEDITDRVVTFNGTIVTVNIPQVTGDFMVAISYS